MRGKAGDYPLDPRTAHALGVALGSWASSTRGNEVEEPPEVVIGMDTRESGPWLAEQVAGGLERSGAQARFAGVITTPGIAFLARSGPFAAGVMVSASHNPYQDNGLKIIDHSGYKLADEVELGLEQSIFEWLAKNEEAAAKPLRPDESLDRQYENHLASTFQGKLNCKLVVDSANGSATIIGPELLEHLGASVIRIGAEPNGRNINLNCGSLHLENLRAKVIETGADLGVAFDGDADRALFVSGKGKIIDGDGVLFLTALAMKKAGTLRGNAVVATVMSNLGLQKALEQHGIQLIRTPVGDKYVLEEMRRRSAVLGGEQSGHVIFSEYATTGDGLLTALRILEIVRDSGKTIDELTSALPAFPQKLVNVRFKIRRPLEDLASVQNEILAAEKEFAGAGRVVVRFSGTEPLARVMIEADSEEGVDKWTSRIADAIRQELGVAE